jgi:hypothetical protein
VNNKCFSRSRFDPSAARKGDSSASTQECPQSKLNITCSVWLDNDNRFSVNLAHKDQVADPVQKCVDKAVSVFKFVMEIPDPSQAKSDSMTQSRSAVRTKTLHLVCSVFCAASITASQPHHLALGIIQHFMKCNL